MPDKYNNSFIAVYQGFSWVCLRKSALKIIRKEIKRLCVSQKHIGRCMPGDTNGPEWGAKIHGCIMVTTTSRKWELFGEAAGEGVHALEMRFMWEFCGTRIKNRTYGDMMESVDVSDSKSDDREVVWVRVPLSPPASQIIE